ncbi:hypothetical protein SMICM17S_07152 [Streptomyces microflavus]
MPRVRLLWSESSSRSASASPRWCCCPPSRWRRARRPTGCPLKLPTGAALAAGRTAPRLALVVAFIFVSQRGGGPLGRSSARSHLITIAGNIPLNNALAQLQGGDDSAARKAFEPRWNTLHQVRTALALVACVLLAVAL